MDKKELIKQVCSHLFQRVASFLLYDYMNKKDLIQEMFSSLSESGFIPTFK